MGRRGDRVQDNTRNTGSHKFNQYDNYRRNIGESEARQSAAAMKQILSDEKNSVATEKNHEALNWYLALFISLVIVAVLSYIGFISIEIIIKSKNNLT